MTARAPARRRNRTRLVGGVLLVIYLAFAAAVVLWPQRVDGDPLQVYRVLYDLYDRGLPRWLTYNVVQFVANVVLTAPIGFFLAMMLPRHLWWVAAAACAAVFAAVEGAQLFLPARVPSLLDLLANSLGGFLGALGWRLAGRSSEEPRLY